MSWRLLGLEFHVEDPLVADLGGVMAKTKKSSCCVRVLLVVFFSSPQTHISPQKMKSVLFFLRNTKYSVVKEKEKMKVLVCLTVTAADYCVRLLA